jgi:hypothetical protein
MGRRGIDVVRLIGHDHEGFFFELLLVVVLMSERWRGAVVWSTHVCGLAVVIVAPRRFKCVPDAVGVIDEWLEFGM